MDGQRAQAFLFRRLEEAEQRAHRDQFVARASVDRRRRVADVDEPLAIADDDTLTEKPVGARCKLVDHLHLDRPRQDEQQRGSVVRSGPEVELDEAVAARRMTQTQQAIAAVDLGAEHLGEFGPTR